MKDLTTEELLTLLKVNHENLQESAIRMEIIEGEPYLSFHHLERIQEIVKELKNKIKE